MIETMRAYLAFHDRPMYPNTETVLEILADFEVAATFSGRPERTVRAGLGEEFLYRQEVAR
jgi:hypothetical protein